MTKDSIISQDSANPTYLYAAVFVDELQRTGIRNVVICPGSRSTPLAMAFAAQTAIRTWMHVDERSAAFFGLGMAKRLRQPVTLLCSSGTAAANFLPALVEATLSHVPLLVLTADRPPELWDNGAPQSIDQNRLYGTYAKWFVDVALPEATNVAFRYIRTIADRAVATARAVPPAPVHLNFPFREPLTPEPVPELPLPPIEQRDLTAWEGRPANAPYTEVYKESPGILDRTTIGKLVHMIDEARRGLIIVGPNDNPTLLEPLVKLAEYLGYPILADPLSQLRCGIHNRSLVLTSYDAFLRIDSFVESVQPELIIRFGAMPTSKSLLLYLKRFASTPLVVIDGNAGWEEPTQLASQLIHANPTVFCNELLNGLEQWQTAVEELSDTAQARDQDSASAPSIPLPTLDLTDNDRGKDQDSASAPSIPLPTPVPTSGYLAPASWRNVSQAWVSMWQNTDRITQQALQHGMCDFKEIFEGRVFSELAHLLQDGAILYVGNSMPIRDMDTFFWSSDQKIHIMGNRGANGIDGIISSALGVSAVAQHDPTVLVLGDLSFFHDLNGLLAARLHELNLTIIVINNDGGGIFSFLPQAAYPEYFEQLFGTPTGLDLRHAVEMYAGRFHRVDDWESFRKVVQRGLNSDGLDVIEVTTERSSNVKMHRLLWEVVKKAINK